MTFGRTVAQHWTPAQRDLLAMLAAVVNGRTPDASPQDWASLLYLADLHGLDAFLYAGVSRWPVSLRPPSQVMDAWRRAFLGRAAAAVRTFHQIGDLLAALNAAGVQALPLKGAWLAEHVYDDIAFRPMTDIDLLIRPDDLDSARRAFAAAGYRACDQQELNPWRKDQHFRHPNCDLGVELQWHVWTPTHDQLSQPALERLWSQTIPATVAGQPSIALPPAQHLVYLIYHILAHHWRTPIRAHLDLVMSGRRYVSSLTGAGLASEAHAWNLGFRAPFVWRVAHDLCGAEPPDSLAGWAPRDTGWLEKERSAACKAALQEAPPHVTVSVCLSDFHQAPLRRRMALALSRVFLSREALSAAHPRATRLFGRPGGYTARLWDLLRRRTRDILPGAASRPGLASAVTDMSARVQLDRWLRAQEK